MKESHTEGLATHGDPESCGDAREGRARSVDRGTRRPGIEPRNRDHFRVPTPFPERKATPDRTENGECCGTWRGRETPSTRGNSMRENRETLRPPAADGAAGRDGKSEDASRSMYGRRESDCPVVPTKFPNKGDGAEQGLWRS